MKFHYDKNISNAEKQNFKKNIEQTKVENNIGITINNLIKDDKTLFILYTINGKEDTNKMQNLLVNNFLITDEKNNEILNSNKDFKSQMLPPKLENTKESIFLLSNKKYKCIVSSLGNTLENYSKEKQTLGSIELINLDNTKLPDEISIKISNITEVYNMSYSKEKYNSFVSNFKREPINIEGNWSFNFKTN